jgi:hypothetical protein
MSTDFSWLDGWVEENLSNTVTLVLAQLDSPLDFLTTAGAAPDGREMTGIYEVLDEVESHTGPHGWTATGALMGAMTVAPGWVLGVEGFGTPISKLAELSAGGTAVGFSYTIEFDDWFEWHEHRVQIAEAELSNIDHLYGTDPGRLTALLPEAGVEPPGTDMPVSAAAVLFEKITGVVLTEAMLTEGKFTVGKVSL